MAIRLYDTMHRKTVEMTTRDPGKVAMYVCGPTVYNYQHIGNFRTFIWFDAIRRYISYRAFDVTFVMNYTDVDDRIIERANIEGISTDAIASKYSRLFEEDMEALGISPPDILTLATTHIDDMVKAIEGLIERGFAYDVEGDVFFAVEKFADYGKLSGRSLEDMRAGERIEPHPSKQHPLDFALWKSAKEGEPSWSSPWGPGRPGWHIECSVMSTKYLGMNIDIHGGGTDLVFPHHENEIAQAEALVDDKPFVRHWLHSGHVLMESEKMSKSIGNVVLAREVAERYGRGVTRYWALQSSYRAQAMFSETTLDEAAQSYERWTTFVDAARHVLEDDMPSAPQDVSRPDADPSSEEPPPGYVQRFIDAMDDDFNSAEAFAVIHELVREGNKQVEAAQRGDADARGALATSVEIFFELTGVLGFRFEPTAGDSALTAGLIEYMLELRDQARAEKAFDRADAIRAKLLELGVAIEDTPAGTRWRLGAGQPG